MSRLPIPLAPYPIVAALTLALSGAVGAEERLYEWNATKDAVVANKLVAIKGPNGSFAQPPVFDPEGHLLFDGKQAVTFPEAEARKIPLQNFSVEARVRIDQPQKWGCIVGYTQDNGSYERGWLLGYNDDKFCFKLSNGGALSGAVSLEKFETGKWVELTAMFNGKAAYLFVNGVLAGSGPLAGKVSLPKTGTPFALGAYQDDDENFPMTGRIDYVKISKGLLPAYDLPEVVPAPEPPAPPKAVAEKGDVKFAVHPRAAFPDPATAVISWQSASHDKHFLFYGTGKTLENEVAISGADGRFSITLPNLQHATEYKYRIAVGAGTQRKFSPIYSLDTRFNLSPAKVEPLAGTSPELLEYCDKAIALAPDQSGYALVLGLDDGRLAAALAARSRFHVIAADPDPAKVTAARRTLYQAGLLGHRVSVLQLDDTRTAPWTDSFADLILSEQADPVLSGGEYPRLLRPNGGVLILPTGGHGVPWDGMNWTGSGRFRFFKRGNLEGASDWTHQYGTAGNASYTGEALGEVSATSGLGLQWIGRPGGDFGIDRQPRMPAPLAANGRLFHQGMDRLVALNAFNGAVLWSYEIPALRRLNVAHDCANWSADDNHLFVAIRDRLWMLDAKSGELVSALQLPDQERETHEWGYIANEGEIMVGSAVRADSAFQNYWGGSQWFDKVGSTEGTTQVCSDRLFGHRKSDAKELWTYGRGTIINSTLSLHDGKLYFLENSTFKIPTGASGRVTDRRLWLNLTTVCLDASTGQILWEAPAPKLEHLTEKVGFVQSAYGIATDEGFVAVLSEGNVDAQGTYLKNGKFSCAMFNHAGGMKWETTSPWMADHHGVHITHPVVTEDRLYLAPQIHDLKTGRALGMTYGPRRGCSTIVATKNALMFRILGDDGSPLGLWDQKTGSVSRLPRLRPSCWLNTLPTQGLLLIPEGGAGCSCGGWIETSVGFLPRSLPAKPKSR